MSEESMLRSYPKEILHGIYLYQNIFISQIQNNWMLDFS